VAVDMAWSSDKTWVFFRILYILISVQGIERVMKPNKEVAEQTHKHAHFVIPNCRYYKSKEHGEYVQNTSDTNGKSSETTLLPIPIFVIFVITIISVASAPKLQMWWRSEMWILWK
jgi:archaellum component FlaF (FlaF/FlaG flagellin family)